jgi:hypothetical protein
MWFVYVVNQRRAFSVLGYVDNVGCGGRYIRTKIRGNLWGTMCRCSKEAWIMEHSRNGKDRKHEKLPLVQITMAYKISALTPLVVTHLHLHKGAGNRNDSLEW